MTKHLILFILSILFHVSVCSQEIDSTKTNIEINSIQRDYIPTIDSTRKYAINKLSDTTRVVYYAPKWHESVTNIPGDFKVAGKILFSKQSLKPLAIIAGSTAILYAFDKQLVDGVQQFSRNIGLNPTSSFKTGIGFGDVDLMQVPGNLNSGFYYIGEGWTSVLIFGGIGIHGAITGNKKEIRMLSQFVEGYIEMGVVTQIFKRSFGRETPRATTSDRGRFRLFPSFSNYQNHMPQYDAMPSGHMATMAFTVTLLSENYPNNKWIRPVGYSLIGICSFSMLNNGVHWASDYPLGFGIGYLFAKVVAKRGRVLQNIVGRKSALNHLEMSPTILNDGSTGISLSLKL